MIEREIKNQKTIEQMCQEISAELLDTIRLLDTLNELEEGAKEITLLQIIRKKVKFSFKQLNNCRRIISVCD